MSTSDDAIASGIDGYGAVSGFWMTTVPPAAFTCRAPPAPSDPVPDRITAVTPSPYAPAADAKIRSIDGVGRLPSSPPTRILPSATSIG